MTWRIYVAPRRKWVPTLAPLFVAVGQANETDLAQPIAHYKAVTVNQATETELAQTIAPSKVSAIGQATETDLAQPVTWAPKHRLVNQATETDLAQAVTAVQSGQLVVLGQATETDLAQAVTHPMIVAVGQATETDLAQPINPNPPILRGTVGADSASTTYVVDVTSVCQGAPLLTVAAHDGAVISPPVPSGGGITSYEYVPHGFSYLAEGEQSRSVWNIWLHGTLDGTDITLTFPTVVDGCRAALIDCPGPHATTPFIHAEGLVASIFATAADRMYHQRLASPNNTLISTWAPGRSGGQSVTWDAGMTELIDIDPGAIMAFSVAYIRGGLADHRVDITLNEDVPHAPKTLLEFVPVGEDTGSPAYRRELLFANAGSGTSRDTAAMQPVAGEVTVIAFLTQRTAASADPSSVQFDPTGTPVSFTKVAAVNVDADRRLHVWAHRFTSTPSAAGIRMTFGATQLGYVWSVWNLVNTAGSTDTDWCDTPVTATGTGTTASADLTTLVSSAGVLGIFGKDTAAADYTVEGGFVPMHQIDRDGHPIGGATTGGLFVEWSGGDGDTSPAASIGSSADWAAIALEVFGSTAQTISIGQATETDLAQPVGKLKVRSIGQATETDLAQAVTPLRTRSTGQATETDVAQPVAHSKAVTVAQVLETDLAQTIAPREAHAIGQALETDLAQPVAATKSRSVGQALETDTAQPIAKAKVRSVGQATETDLAQAVAWAPKHRLVNRASETDLAQAITTVGAIMVGQAPETDLAQPIAHSKVRSIGQALETDAAQVVAPVEAHPIGQATETDLAQAVAHAKALTVGQANETDLAQAISARRTVPVSQAVETDLAQTVAWAPKHRLIRQATETDVAQPVAITGATLLSQATETDLAQPITVVRLTTVVQALETDTAQAIQPRKTRSIGQALEVDLAQPLGNVSALGQALEVDLARKIKALFANMETPEHPPHNELSGGGTVHNAVSGGTVHNAVAGGSSHNEVT